MFMANDLFIGVSLPLSVNRVGGLFAAIKCEHFYGCVLPSGFKRGIIVKTIVRGELAPLLTIVCEHTD